MNHAESSVELAKSAGFHAVVPDEIRSLPFWQWSGGEEALIVYKENASDRIRPFFKDARFANQPLLPSDTLIITTSRLTIISVSNETKLNLPFHEVTSWQKVKQGTFNDYTHQYLIQTRQGILDITLVTESLLLDAGSLAIEYLWNHFFGKKEPKNERTLPQGFLTDNGKTLNIPGIDSLEPVKQAQPEVDSQPTPGGGKKKSPKTSATTAFESILTLMVRSN